MSSKSLSRSATVPARSGSREDLPGDGEGGEACAENVPTRHLLSPGAGQPGKQMPTSPTPLPKAGPESRRRALHAVRGSGLLSSSPGDSGTAHGGWQGVTREHRSRAASAGSSLPPGARSCAGGHWSSWPKQLGCAVTTETRCLSRKMDLSWLFVFTKPQRLGSGETKTAVMRQGGRPMLPAS